jgi:hypothetical protein
MEFSLVFSLSAFRFHVFLYCPLPLSWFRMYVPYLRTCVMLNRSLQIALYGPAVKPTPYICIYEHPCISQEDSASLTTG